MNNKVGAEKLLTMLLAGLWLMLFSSLSPATPNSEEYIGDSACLTCHEEVGGKFETTPHGLANIQDRYAVVGCESCHGPGAVHSGSGDPVDILVPDKLEPYRQSQICNSCHGSLTAGFGFNHTEAAGGCNDCHVVHSENDRLLRQQGAELCFSCHAEVRGMFAMPSHHPVLENQMSCNDCHQVHGNKATAMLDNTQREQCLTCHAEKQGPFVFEHDPVNEDCSICHNPHGSVADNLLIQAEPFVCLSCHPMHFHTSLAGFVGDYTPPVHPERSGTSTAEGFKPAMLTKCTQCHTEIHGSDLPAQSISGPGALTR